MASRPQGPKPKARVFQSGGPVPRKQFVQEVADLTGLDIDTAKRAVEVVEDLIMQHIALEDTMEFSFGKIFGYTKFPIKIGGFYSVLKKLQERNGWTVAKSGSPNIEWSAEAKYYTATHPTTFFEWPEIRYTTRAREYRKSMGLPELEEFQGLSEEKIQEFCEKADAQIFGPKTKGQLMEEKKRKDTERRIRMGDYAYFRAVDRELQLEKGVKEEDLVEHTREEVIKMQQEKWKSSQHAETGEKKKRRNYEIPEKYKKNILEMDKREYEENKLEKYLMNDSQIYVDPELYKKVSEAKEEQVRAGLIEDRTEAVVTLPEKATIGSRKDSLGTNVPKKKPGGSVKKMRAARTRRENAKINKAKEEVRRREEYQKLLAMKGIEEDGNTAIAKEREELEAKINKENEEIKQAKLEKEVLKQERKEAKRQAKKEERQAQFLEELEEQFGDK